MLQISKKIIITSVRLAKNEHIKWRFRTWLCWKFLKIIIAPSKHTPWVKNEKHVWRYEKTDIFSTILHPNQRFKHFNRDNLFSWTLLFKYQGFRWKGSCKSDRLSVKRYTDLLTCKFDN